jgi:hypothetical protein
VAAHGGAADVVNLGDVNHISTARSTTWDRVVSRRLQAQSFQISANEAQWHTQPATRSRQA